MTRRRVPWLLALVVPLAAGQDASTPELVLVREAKLESLLGCGKRPYEASGVEYAQGRFEVVFDNLAQLAIVDEGFTREGSRLTAPLEGVAGSGFESIAWDPQEERFYVAVEAAQRGHDAVPRLLEVDRELRLVRQGWLDPPVAEANKGVEGLAVLHRDGEVVLLALLEGNHGEGGRRGRDRGHGLIRVHVRQPDGNWALRTTIELPPSVAFEDYAGIDVDGDRLAIVSQASSLLWVGRLRIDAWAVDGPGRSYAFPRVNGQQVYGNVEGVAWIDERRLAFVSDQAKPDHLEARGKDQSIHIFSLPTD